MAVLENQEIPGGEIMGKKTHVKKPPRTSGPLQDECKIRFSELGARAFRINVGMGWTGNDIVHLSSGSLLIKDPRPFHTGVKKGYVDLTGYYSVVITQEMVGKKFARFFAADVKTGKDKLKPEQRDFLNSVKQAGGLTGVLRSVDDCEGILNEELQENA